MFLHKKFVFYWFISKSKRPFVCLSFIFAFVVFVYLFLLLLANYQEKNLSLALTLRLVFREIKIQSVNVKHTFAMNHVLQYLYVLITLNSYDIVRLLLFLIPISVVMVHFSTYAQPCVYKNDVCNLQTRSGFLRLVLV